MRKNTQGKTIDKSIAETQHMKNILHLIAV